MFHVSSWPAHMSITNGQWFLCDVYCMMTVARAYVAESNINDWIDKARDTKSVLCFIWR